MGMFEGCESVHVPGSLSPACLMQQLALALDLAQATFAPFESPRLPDLLALVVAANGCFSFLYQQMQPRVVVAFLTTSGASTLRGAMPQHMLDRGQIT